MAKKICPKCASKNTVKIVYGYPGPELMMKYKEGKVKLGGCVISFDNPDTYCKDCEHSFMSVSLDDLIFPKS